MSLSVFKIDHEMAERQLTDENGNEEELLRDSLDSVECVALDGSILSPNMATNETRPKLAAGKELGPVIHVTRDTHLIKEPLNLRNENVEQKTGNTCIHDVKKKDLVKTSKKITTLLDKNGRSKGCQNMNYSEIYQKRLKQECQRDQSLTRNDNRRNITMPSSTNENQTKHMTKDTNGLPEKIKEGHSLIENETNDYLENGGYNYSGARLTQKCDQGISDQDEETFESDCKLYWSEQNNHELHYPISLSNKGMQQDYDILQVPVFPYLQSVPEVPTSDSSTPAYMYTSHYSSFENPQYKVKANSVCSMHGKHPSYSCNKLDNSLASISSNFKTNGKSDNTSYSAIYAKQYTYQPYTLSDYKRLKQTLPGCLGQDTNSEEYKHKVNKVIRQKEYAAVVRQNHVLDNSHWKKKTSIVSTQKRSPHVQEADARRQKALQYAKAVPKPITTNRQTSEVNAAVDHQEPNTLLDILRQRHEREKKAIDAVRKDIETKLKTR